MDEKESETFCFIKLCLKEFFQIHKNRISLDNFRISEAKKNSIIISINVFFVLIEKLCEKPDIIIKIVFFPSLVPLKN